MLTTDTVGFGLIVACLAPVGAFLGIWLLRVIPQRPFEMLALSLAGVAAVRLIWLPWLRPHRSPWGGCRLTFACGPATRPRRTPRRS